MSAEVRSCTRCILPETYPGITFNEEGVCNFCLSYQPYHHYLGKEKLLELLRSRPVKRDVDCIVPISGGKDSTYILYYAVKHLGLRPLAVMHNSGFQHELAIGNARTACRTLGVPLKEVDSGGPLRRAMLKESLLASQSLNEFWHACGNCEAILRTVAARAAREAGTPFILWGSSALESGETATYLEYKNLGAAEGSFVRRAAKRVMGKLRTLARDRHALASIIRTVRWHAGYHPLRYSLLSLMQRMRLGFPLRYALRPHAVPPFGMDGAVFVHFFDYIEWDSIGNIRVLEDELGWRHPEGKESRWDCSIHCLGNFESMRTRRVSIEGINSCNFIREEKMDRADALGKERGLFASLAGECSELIAQMGIRRYRMPEK